MSQKNKETASGQEWFDLQKNMWEGWCHLAKNNLDEFLKNGQQPTESDFYTLVKDYWENPSLVDGVPAEAQQMLSRMIHASKSYFDLAEQSIKLSEEGVNLHQVASDWAERVSKTFGAVAGIEYSELESDALKDFRAFWDLPQDTWQRTFSALFPFPGDMFRALRPEGINRMPGDVHGRLDRFLSVPALGYTRESQEKYKKLGKLYLDYQKALYDYNVALAKVNLEAVEHFQKKLHETTDSGEPIDSIKAIYDLWVDASEEVYAEFAMSEAYTVLYGRLVNALMGVKRQTARIVDEYFESLNMPTRKEINTLHKRVQAIRRDYNTLRCDEIETMAEEVAQVSSLKDEVQSLKDEIASLKEQVKAVSSVKQAATKVTTTPPKSSNVPPKKNK